jgi:hypothetical protein
MHIPTPHLKKSDSKRKASLDSLAPEDDAPVLIEKKTPKSKKKAKTIKGKKDKTAMPDDTLMHHATSSPPPPRSRSPSLTALPRIDSGTEMYVLIPNLSHLTPCLDSQEIADKQPKPTPNPAAPRASKPPCTPSRKHGPKRGRTSSVSTAPSCRWNIRGRARITRGMVLKSTKRDDMGEGSWLYMYM